MYRDIALAAAAQRVGVPAWGPLLHVTPPPYLNMFAVMSSAILWIKSQKAKKMFKKKKKKKWA